MKIKQSSNSQKMKFFAKKEAKIVVLILTLFFYGCSFQPSQNMTVFFFDVGQGDSTLIQSPDYLNILIDCGKDEKSASYLSALNITTIDVLIITHSDSDHDGGCKFIENNFDVKEKITKKNSRKIGKYVKIIPTKKFNNKNDNSIITKAKFGSVSFLFPGDCGRECENETTNYDIDVDVLKAGHHGSKHSSTNLFLNATTPKIAVISSGENSYGHPHNETLMRFEERNITIFKTDKIGTIIITTEGEKIIVN